MVSKSISEDSLVPKIGIDLEVDFDFINFKTLKIIDQMAPFGPHNLQPVFVSKKGKSKRVTQGD